MQINYETDVVAWANEQARLIRAVHWINWRPISVRASS